jgi:hypothetical protein
MNFFALNSEIINITMRLIMLKNSILVLATPFAPRISLSLPSATVALGPVVMWEFSRTPTRLKRRAASLFEISLLDESASKKYRHA